MILPKSLTLLVDSSNRFGSQGGTASVMLTCLLTAGRYKKSRKQLQKAAFVEAFAKLMLSLCMMMSKPLSNLMSVTLGRMIRQYRF